MKKLNKIFIVTLVLILSVINVSASTETVGTFTVKYGEEYAEPNHGFIKSNLLLKDASISGDICENDDDYDCFQLVEMYGAYRQAYDGLTPDTTEPSKSYTLIYRTTLAKFKEKSVNNNNEFQLPVSIDKSFSLTWENAVVLAKDSSKTNLTIDVSDIEFFYTKTDWFANDFDSNIFILPILRDNSEYNSVELLSSKPLMGFPTSAADAINNKILEPNVIGQIGNKYKITMNIGETTNSNDKYIGFGFKDLDIHDRTKATTVTEPSEANGCVKIDGWVCYDQYDNDYSESIWLSKSFTNPIYLAPKQDNTISALNTYLSVASKGDTLRIYPNGKVYTSSALASKPQKYMDDNKFYSGFITSMPMTGASFYWSGSYCGTQLFQTTTVNIEQTHTEGGEVYIDEYFGSDKYLKNSETNEHLVGSEPVYICKPADGYYAKSVTVNGRAIEVTPDCKYQFDPLKFLPLLGEGQKYTIHVEFAKKPSTPEVNPKTGIAAITGIVGLAIIAGATVYIKKNKYAE